MDISIIIPSLNGLQYFKDYLPSIIASAKDSGFEIEIIIIDDNSTDGTLDFVNAEYNAEPMVKCVPNPRRGACSARNFGVSVSSGSILLFIDNDVVLDKGFFANSMPLFSDPEIGAVACAGYYEADGRQIDGVKLLEWRKGFFRFTSNILNKDLKEVPDGKYMSYGIQGAYFFCRRDAFDAVDGINEILEPYLLEETDLIYKVMKCGYKIAYAKDTHPLHRWGGTVKSKTSERTKYLSIRNRYIFVYIHMHSISYILCHFLLLPFRFLSKLDRKALKEVVGLRKRILESRKIEIARSKISDAQLLKDSSRYKKIISK